MARMSVSKTDHVGSSPARCAETGSLRKTMTLADILAPAECCRKALFLYAFVAQSDRAPIS